MADLLSPTQELFLVALEECDSLQAACESVGLSLSYGYSLQAELAEEIIVRARSHLASFSLKASKVVTDSLTVDGAKEKVELHLKAAEAILDRTGVTKHTNVDVRVEAENGIFILPAKEVVLEETPEDDSEGTEDSSED